MRKQIYYVIQTLLRGRGSNIIKIISLGLSLTMSILLFSRVAYEQSLTPATKTTTISTKSGRYLPSKGEKYPPQEQNCGPVAGAILENFPGTGGKLPPALATGKILPCTMGNIRFDEKKIVADSLFFQTMGIEVLSGNPVKDLQQPNVIFLSDRFAERIFGGEDPVGKTINYNHEKEFFMVKGTYKRHCPKTLLSILKPLSPCLPYGTKVPAVTIHGRAGTVILNTSVSVPVRTSRW